jgi:hypothetical protein
MKCPVLVESCGLVQVILSIGSRKKKMEKLGILFSFCWQLWKERNALRTFDHKDISASCLASQSRDTIRPQAIFVSVQVPLPAVSAGCCRSQGFGGVLSGVCRPARLMSPGKSPGR